MTLKLNTGKELEITRVNTNINPDSGFPNVFIDVLNEDVCDMINIFTSESCKNMVVDQNGKLINLITPLKPINFTEIIEKDSVIVTVLLEGVTGNNEVTTNDAPTVEVDDIDEELMYGG